MYYGKLSILTYTPLPPIFRRETFIPNLHLFWAYFKEIWAFQEIWRFKEIWDFDNIWGFKEMWGFKEIWGFKETTTLLLPCIRR